MTHSKSVSVLTLAAAIAAFASLGPPAVQAQTQTQMNTQAERDAAKADAAMNAEYKKLMAVLNVLQKSHLRHSQQA